MNKKAETFELEVLSNLAYSFYPEGISFQEELEKYQGSFQFQSLKKRVEDHISGNDIIQDFKLSLQKINNGKTFQDCSRFTWFDRSYNFNFFKSEKNFIYCLCLNISVLIPYYTVYVVDVKLKGDSTNWERKPKRNKELEMDLYKNEISDIRTLVERKLQLNFFPSDGFDFIVKDISFQDIKMGEFTLFQAFFLNEFLIR